MWWEILGFRNGFSGQFELTTQYSMLSALCWAAYCMTTFFRSLRRASIYDLIPEQPPHLMLITYGAIIGLKFETFLMDCWGPTWIVQQWGKLLSSWFQKDLRRWWSVCGQVYVWMGYANLLVTPSFTYQEPCLWETSIVLLGQASSSCWCDIAKLKLLCRIDHFYWRTLPVL